MEKPINQESKGYGNLGWGNPKNLAEAHENEGLEWARMPKEMKWAEDVQKNKMAQGSSKAMKWAKEAQNNMSTSPMIVLGYWNYAEGKHTTGPKEA